MSIKKLTLTARSYGNRGKYVAVKVRHLFGLCKAFG